MIKILSALLTLISASSARATTTLCGDLLRRDPHFRHIESPMFDRPVIQNLLTLRLDQIRRPILLVGGDEGARKLLVEALLDKVSEVGAPLVIINSREMESNLPMPAPASEDEPGEGLTEVLGNARFLLDLPKHTTVVMNFELADYLRTGSAPILSNEISEAIEYDYEHGLVTSIFEFLVSTARHTEGLTLLTMPQEAYYTHHQEGSPILRRENFLIIDLDAPGFAPVRARADMSVPSGSADAKSSRGGDELLK